MSPSDTKPKKYKASHDLQSRIGTGPLDRLAVERAQKEIDNNTIDFAPLGLDFLKRLDDSIQDIKSNPSTHSEEDKIKQLTAPVMELKANAAIFHYELVGNLASIMLSFLESIDKLDNDAVSIVSGHHDSLKLILKSKMKGNGGDNGKVMEQELNDACARYYKKKKKQE